MTDNEEKSRKLHRASEAKRILAEPLLRGFFKNQEDECIEAFKRLPIGSKIEEYQTVHHALLANIKLMAALQAHIEDYNMMVVQEQRQENIVEGI